MSEIIFDLAYDSVRKFACISRFYINKINTKMVFCLFLLKRLKIEKINSAPESFLNGIFN